MHDRQTDRHKDRVDAHIGLLCAHAFHLLHNLVRCVEVVALHCTQTHRHTDTEHTDTHNTRLKRLIKSHYLHNIPKIYTTYTNK